jgi:hypothetical protein
MDQILNMISDPTVQRTLSWLGGGLTVLATAIWALFKFYRKGGSGSAPSANVRTDTGIAAIGDVNIGRDVRISRGVPAWVIALLILGFVLIVLRMLSGMAELDNSDVAHALRDGYLRGWSVDGSAVVIALREDRSVLTHVSRSEGSVISGGTWTIQDDGAVCLRLFIEIKGAGSRFCLTPQRASGGVRPVAPEGSSLDWVAQRPDPALLNPAGQASDNAVTLDVPANAAPWSTSANPRMLYGVGDGAKATFVSSSDGFTFVEGAKFRIQVVSGRSNAGAGWPNVAFTGDPAMPTYATDGSSGSGFPAQYTSKPREGNLMGLVGVFVDDGGVIVGSPFLIVESTTTIKAPNGASRLQFGVNDDIFSDNSGRYKIIISQPS